MQKDAHCSTVNSNKNGKQYECLKRAWFGKQGHIHLMECCTVFLNDGCKDYVVTSKKHMDFSKKTDFSCTLSEEAAGGCVSAETTENWKDPQDSRYWS